MVCSYLLHLSFIYSKYNRDVECRETRLRSINPNMINNFISHFSDVNNQVCHLFVDTVHEGQCQSTPENRYVRQGVLHFWSKFGDSSLNGWHIIARTTPGLTNTHGNTHTQTDADEYNTRRPKLASDKKNQLHVFLYSVRTSKWLAECNTYCPGPWF